MQKEEKQKILNKAIQSALRRMLNDDLIVYDVMIETFRTAKQDHETAIWLSLYMGRENKLSVAQIEKIIAELERRKADYISDRK